MAHEDVVLRVIQVEMPVDDWIVLDLEVGGKKN